MQSLVKDLKKLGVEAARKYLSGFESTRKLQPRHYELWLNADWH